jgi:hypothetical protein
MTEPRFDRLARSLATLRPRRRLFAVATATVSGALLGHDHDALAGCKKVGCKCDKNSDCCDGARCRGGECRCTGGRTECGGKCFNLDTDERHCGACDSPCADPGTCTNGICQFPAGFCAPGADSCGGGGNVSCGGPCTCSQSTEGETVCGLQIAGVFCGACDTSADCAAFGADTFCAATGLGTGGCCGPGAENICRRRCPA